MKTAILWFRRDLRLLDNPALNWVLHNCDRVLPIYIHSPDEEAPWQPGAASRWWLHHSLHTLQRSLSQHGLELQIFMGSSVDILRSLLQVTGARTIACNQLYEPHIQQRFNDLRGSLSTLAQFQVFHSGLFFEPGSVLNNQQQAYRVYTPFYKKSLSLLEQKYSHYRVNEINSIINRIQPVQLAESSEIKPRQLAELNLLDNHPWHNKLHHYWTPGETYAHDALEHFLESRVQRYAKQRDLPAIDGTSRLSASLHFGEITPQQIFLSLQPILHQEPQYKEHIQTFLKQLIWREFAQHILWHFPATDMKPMNPRYPESFWQENDDQLNRWKTGTTGIPIVDAGMRQLWETGWMHNRVRMIVSSLLTKNMGIHWLEGARWFWDTLVDADLANNTMGWQWVAGCGVDAAPYYRIFNPLTQAQRFDKQQNYVSSWQNDLSRQIQPIVDLAETRTQALDRYNRLIKTQ